MSEPQQPPVPQRPTLKPDEPKPEMTQEELQRQLLETQKRLVELQEAQNAKQEERHQEAKRTKTGVIIVIVVAVVVALVGIWMYSSIQEYTLEGKKSKYETCMVVSGDMAECASDAGLTSRQLEDLGLVY